MTLTHSLRWGVIAGILAVFLIPLFVANNLFFPFITGKGFAFRILVEITFALWLVWAMRDPSVRPRRSYLLYAFVAFLVVIGLADLFGPNPLKSFWSNFERMEGWIGLAHLFLFFVVTVSVFRTERMWKWLVHTTLTVAFVEELYGLAQIFGLVTIHQGGVRVDASFGNATYLAVYMLLSVFLAALAYLRWGRKSAFLASFYGVVAVLGSVVLFYTATRGTILGFAGGVALAFLVYLFSGKASARMKIWSAAVLAILALIGVGLYAARNAPYIAEHPVLSRIASISLETGETRFTIWSMAAKGFLERPILGWGQENFNHVFNKYYEPSLYGQEPWFDRAHNQFIDWLVAGGVPGFLLYLSFYVVAFWYLFRPGSPFPPGERGVLAGLIAGVAFHNLFVFDNLMSSVLFWTVLAYILARREEAVPEKHPVILPAKTLSENAFIVAAPLVAVAALVILYAVNVPGIARGSELVQAISRQPGGLSENLAHFREAAKGLGLGTQEVREQLLLFGVQARAITQDQAILSEAATFGESEMKKEIARVPNDARLRLFLGSFYRQTDQLDKAGPEVAAARTLSPRKQQILFEVGILESAKGNAREAILAFKEAYDLAPSYDDARIFYAATLLRTGNTALAEALLTDRFGTATPDNDVILQAYLDIRDYRSAIEIAKARVAAEPSNIQRHIQLAAAYLQSGARAESIRVLQEAIKAVPSFKEQGEYYIQEIAAGRNP